MFFENFQILENPEFWKFPKHLKFSKIWDFVRNFLESLQSLEMFQMYGNFPPRWKIQNFGNVLVLFWNFPKSVKFPIKLKVSICSWMFKKIENFPYFRKISKFLEHFQLLEISKMLEQILKSWKFQKVGSFSNCSENPETLKVSKILEISRILEIFKNMENFHCFWKSGVGLGWWGFG